ncbi:MAG: transporter substrate-binding domain-containing protein [Magnetococcales bacterium]|nr:transporter substrate-binding domain-containing protein [Magnetococcales bacterium]
MYEVTKIRSWSSLLIFAVLSLLGITSIPKAVQASPEILIGVNEDDYRPYSYYAEGRYQGTLILAVQQAAMKLGYKIRFIGKPWKTLLNEMENGELDAMMPLYKTPQREKFMHFVKEPLLYEENHLIYSSANPIAFDGSAESLQGLRIGVVRGWTYGGQIVNWHGFERISLNDQKIVVRNVASGRLHGGFGIRSDMLDHATKLGVEDKVGFASTPINRQAAYLAFSYKPGHKTLANLFSEKLKNINKLAQKQR